MTHWRAPKESVESYLWIMLWIMAVVAVVVLLGLLA